MLQISIDGKEVSVEQGATVIEAAQKLGTYIPHFCYHKKLSIAANCRMCLVEVEKAPKPLPACATPVTDGMVVHTHSKMAKQAQEGVMEFLLINHPLDCPVCDKGCIMTENEWIARADSSAVWCKVTANSSKFCASRGEKCPSRELDHCSALRAKSIRGKLTLRGGKTCFSATKSHHPVVLNFHPRT